MEDADILARLTVICRKVFNLPDAKIDVETNAEIIEEWNSLSHLILIDQVEREFSVQFSLGDLMELKSIGDLIFLVQRKLQP